MHQEAMSFARRCVRDRRFVRVVEFGSRDVNGTIKPSLDCEEYVGIDLLPGPNVDIVADATRYQGERYADLVVCMEVLEHAPDVEGLIRAASRNLCHPNGWLLITCATDPREPHSAIDGGPLRWDEHYGNVAPADLAAMLGHYGFVIDTLRVLDRGDLQVWAERA